MDTPVSFDFRETSLTAAVRFLQEQTNITIIVDPAAFDADVEPPAVTILSATASPGNM